MVVPSQIQPLLSETEEIFGSGYSKTLIFIESDAGQLVTESKTRSR